MKRQGIERSFWIGVVSCAALALLGCEKSDKSPSASEKVAQVAPSPEAQPAASPGKPSYDENAFQLELRGPKAAKVGDTLELTIVLSAKNGYKVNAEYPVKFRFGQLQGLKAEKAVVTKDDAKLEKMKVELPARVTVDQSGELTVKGKLSFSVCTDDQCLIEKRDLALPIDAS